MKVDKEHLIYTPNYCEENVYKLSEYLRDFDNLHCGYVVFVSNINKSVGLFAQVKGDPQMDHFIIWDYHVFLICHSEHKYWVYDFDSLLPFPSPFIQYVTHGLRQNIILPEKLHRSYRVIPVVDYLNHFSSDRRHMLREDGNWIAPPPSYECIRGQSSSSSHTLPFYLDTTIDTVENLSLTSNVYGTVLHESEFFKKFSSV
ncbi:unnamed protein product [Schistosoma turkestanicum]|nr:unnamed protein product [Schistosoma turkestanicum]